MIETINGIVNNPIIRVAFLAWLTAQILKTLISLITTKAFNVERLIGAGGMPSSHSALVCSMTVAVAKVHGCQSTEFAIASILSLIVMYDAMGVRRAAGEQAKVVNQIVCALKINRDKSTDKNYDERFFQGKLKELLGHTPLEVLAGAVLGTVMGIVI